MNFFKLLAFIPSCMAFAVAVNAGAATPSAYENCEGNANPHGLFSNLMANNLGRARELSFAWQFEGKNQPLSAISPRLAADRGFAEIHESAREINLITA